MTVQSLDRHTLAEALRIVAVGLDSGATPMPDDPPLSWHVVDVNGYDLLFELWPDGSATLKHREHNILWPAAWSKPLELVRTQIGQAS